MHSANPLIGQLSTSSPLINAIQHSTRFAALSNQMSVPTDCPQRERRGWLGDAQLSFDTVMQMEVRALGGSFVVGSGGRSCAMR